jgi:hypothetical protein
MSTAVPSTMFQKGNKLSQFNSIDQVYSAIPNTPCQYCVTQFTSLYPEVGPLAEYLVELSHSNEHIHQNYRPPAPRLVGVEPNPGPPKGLAGVLGSAAAALGAAAARSTVSATVKKKKKSSRRRRNTDSTLRTTRTVGENRQFPGPLQTVQAPTALGFRGGSTIKHLPCVINGRCQAFSVQTAGTGSIALTNRNGVTMANDLNIFNVNPVSTGTTTRNFWTFPPAVQSISVAFLRYRFRKLVLTYIPGCPSTTPGSIVFGSIAESTNATGKSVTTSVVADLQVNACTQLWAPIFLDLLVDGGLRKDWLYMDSTDDSAEPAQRQETPGMIAVALRGVPISTYCGEFWYEYEIEFNGLGNMQSLTFSDSSSSSSSSIKSSLPTVVPSNTSTAEAGLGSVPPGYVLVKQEVM